VVRNGKVGTAGDKSGQSPAHQYFPPPQIGGVKFLGHAPTHAPLCVCVYASGCVQINEIKSSLFDGCENRRKEFTPRHRRTHGKYPNGMQTEIKEDTLQVYFKQHCLKTEN